MRALFLAAIFLLPAAALAHEGTHSATYLGASLPGDDLILETCDDAKPLAGACFDVQPGRLLLVTADPAEPDDDRVNLAIFWRVDGEWVPSLVFCLNGGGLWFVPPSHADGIAISNRILGCNGAAPSLVGTFSIRQP